jgi:DNA-binding MarR family transcriptional regulator
MTPEQSRMLRVFAHGLFKMNPVAQIRDMTILLDLPPSTSKILVRPTDLAKIHGLSAPTITKTIQRLDALGLIKRTNSPDDLRQVLVLRSPKADQMFNKIFKQAPVDTADL